MSTNSTVSGYTSPQGPTGPHDDNPDGLSRACDICLQLSIAVATLATACFITLAALHYFTIATALIAAFSGVADIILIASLSCKKCILETPPSDIPTQAPNPSLKPGQPVPAGPNQTDIPPRVTPPIIRPPNPLTAEEWEQKLNILPSNPNFCGYNLIDPTQPPAPNAKNGCISLPTFGNYKQGYRDITHRPAMAVRLTPTQLSAFPKQIQDIFQADPEIELYFLIFDDSGAMSKERNLVLHHMAIPEYDCNKQIQSPVPGLKNAGCEGFACPVGVGIFESRGVENIIKDTMLAHNHLKKTHVHLHPDKGVSMAISPDNSILVTSSKAPVSSFYTAARFRARSVAFYTLLVRDRRSPEGQTISILDAFQQKPLSAILQALQADNSPLAAEVKKLFAYYP